MFAFSFDMTLCSSGMSALLSSVIKRICELPTREKHSIPEPAFAHFTGAASIRYSTVSLSCHREVRVSLLSATPQAVPGERFSLTYRSAFPAPSSTLIPTCPRRAIVSGALVPAGGSTVSPDVTAALGFRYVTGRIVSGWLRRLPAAGMCAAYE